MSDICKEISHVLDTMFNSKIPSEQHLPALIHKLAEEGDVLLALGMRSREVLLSQPTHLMAAGPDKKITHDSLRKSTYAQGGKQCHHIHLKTCHKGYHGRAGCRLCMKAGNCSQTGCIYLQELTNEEAEKLAHSCNQPCWCSIPDNLFLPATTDEDISDEIEAQDDNDCWSKGDIDRFSTASTVNNKTKSEAFFCENEQKTVSIAFEATKNIPPDLLPATYSVINILDKSKPPPLIVWETARTPAEHILDEPGDGEPPFSKDQIIEQLKQNLDTVKEFSDNHPLWEQLNKMSDEDLQLFYQKLVGSFKTANQYIAAYNPSISYCTGAHNNAVLLGSDQQAKAATFYLCPYMGKLKFPLQDCLVILEQALKHVKDFPSVAKDTGTNERTSKHILQRCLNKLNLQMELSGMLLPFTVLLLSIANTNKLPYHSSTDYQMAAVLLRLPSIIRSEQYAYVNPHAHISYITQIHRDKDSAKILDRLIAEANDKRDASSTVDSGSNSFVVDDDECNNEDGKEDGEQEQPVHRKIHDPKAILYQLGYIDNFAVKEGKKTYRYQFPQCSLYAN